jgi:hypothetical protein
MEPKVLKKLALTVLAAALVPVAAVAQPWAQPYADRPYYDQDHGPRYSDDDDRYERSYRDRPYGYWETPYVRGHPAYDQYGPDPNGTRAPDGHRIKCKLVDEWNAYGQYIRRRACW